MSTTKSNLIMGPAILKLAPVGSTEPADIVTAWAAAWKDLGATEGGITIEIGIQTKPLEIDQSVDIPGERVVSRSIMVTTNLAEATLDNLAYALNEPAPAAAVAGIRTFQPTNTLAAINPADVAIGFEGQAPGGFKRRVIIRSCLSVDGTKELSKKDGQKVYAVKWNAHFVSDSIAPFIYIDATA